MPPQESTRQAAARGSDVCGEYLPLLPSVGGEPISIVGPVGSDLNLAPEAAQPALDRIFSAPQSVALVAYQIGREVDGIYLNADLPMPLISVAKIINLVAYAEAVDAGSLDPAAWIPISEIERAYLPGSDLNSHRAAIDELEEKGLVTSDPKATPLEQIPWMMIRHSSNAASDYLHMLIGQDEIELTAVRLNLHSQTAPCPYIGQFLAISNHARTTNNRRALEEYLTDPQWYGQEVMQLADQFMNDPEFRAAEGYWRAPISDQRFFAENLAVSGSARDYAALMASIVQNKIGNDYVNILVRRELEWPMSYPSNQQLFSKVGFKSGSMPGVLNVVYYGQRLDDGALVVVALFFRDLPMGIYRSWRREQPHDELARWLLADRNAITILGEWLDGG